MNCPHCQRSLPPEIGLCPHCHRPIHSVASPFGQIEARLADFNARLATGQINQATMDSAVDKLQLRPKKGQIWWLNSSGSWHRWQGGQWIPATPPSRLQSAKSTGRLALGLGCSGLALLLLLAAVFLSAGWDEYQHSPMLVENVPATAGISQTLEASVDQQAVLADYGNPEAFSLMFYEQPGGSGPMSVRAETWTYYQQDLEFVFINGALVEEIESDFVDANLVPLNYVPGQFIAYMTLDEVLAAAGVDSYLAVPLDSRYLPAGAVYYADGLTFGLQDGELRYLEAMAVEEEVGS